MKKYIGVFSLGPENVRLYVRDGLGGSFDTAPDDNGCASITIGVGHKEMWQSINTLMHEALEMSFVRNDLRYVPSLDYSRDSGSYLFTMTHTQFSEANSWAAMLVTKAFPQVSKAWKNHKKK